MNFAALAMAKRLRGHIALHRAFRIDDERLRIRSVRPHLRILEAVIGLEPLIIGGDALRRDEQRQIFQILEFVDALIGMGDEDLRVFLEQRGDLDHRHVLGDGIKTLQRVGAEEEIDLADRQQDLIVRARAARHDGDVEAVFPVGAVGQRLVEAAVLALRHPIGAERDLVERLRRRPVPPRRRPKGRARPASPGRSLPIASVAPFHRRRDNRA